MRTQELLTAIAADLRAQLPALRSCEVHDGRWDEAEVKRWSIPTPALRVAWLGTAGVEMPGDLWTDCNQQLALFVVTRDSVDGGRRKLGRGEAARNLGDWLLLYIPRARWGLAGIGEATALRAANLYTGKIDATGISMCMVAWQQELRLVATDDGTCPPLPAELYSSAQDDPDEQLYPEVAP